MAGIIWRRRWGKTEAGNEGLLSAIFAQNYYFLILFDFQPKAGFFVTRIKKRVGNERQFVSQFRIKMIHFRIFLNFRSDTDFWQSKSLKS